MNKKFKLNLFKFLALLSLFLVVGLFPELIGGALIEKLKSISGKYFSHLTIGIGILGIVSTGILIFLTEKDNINTPANSKDENCSAEYSEFRKQFSGQGVRVNKSYEGRLNRLEKVYGKVSLTNDNWFSRFFGIGVLPSVFLFGWWYKQNEKPLPPEPNPSPEYESSLPQEADHFETIVKPISSTDPYIEDDGGEFIGGDDDAYFD